MKGIFRKAAAISLSVLVTSPCFPSTHLIYGFEAASHIQSEMQGEFYIQAGSFLHKTKAERLRTVLQSKTHYPINITHNARFYRVIVGPIASTAAVRQTAAGCQLEARWHDNGQGRGYDNSQVRWHDNSQARGHDNIESSMITSTTENKTKTNWYVGVGAGNQFSQFSRSMTVNNNSGAPSPFDQDIYSVKDNNTQAVFTLAAGRRWERNSFWLPAYSAGLFYQHSATTNVGDTITQYSDPEFTNYTYNWNVSSNLILALLKLDIVKWGRVSPYILGGIYPSPMKMRNLLH